MTKASYFQILDEYEEIGIIRKSEKYEKGPGIWKRTWNLEKEPGIWKKILESNI
jgi:hypothetical protein